MEMRYFWRPLRWHCAGKREVIAQRLSIKVRRRRVVRGVLRRGSLAAIGFFWHRVEWRMRRWLAASCDGQLPKVSG